MTETDDTGDATEQTESPPAQGQQSGRKTDQIRQHMLASYKSAARKTGEPTNDLPSEDEAVRKYAPLVWRQARRYARSYGGVINVDDLISVGFIGLLQALKSYKPEGGRAFEVFAEFRIRGAILDELRKFDPMSQPARKKQRQLEAAASRLATQLGRVPTEDELAEFMEVDLATLQGMRRELQAVRFVPEDDMGEDLRASIAATETSQQSLRLLLVDGLTKLPERDQQVLALYYFHDLNLREIGEVLDVTEARVCQLHKAAVEKLRDLLQLDADDRSL